MLFQSNEFIFAFLPVVLVVSYLLTKVNSRLMIPWILGSSFFFYCWHEPAYGILLAGSILANFQIAKIIGRHRSRFLIVIGVSANLGLLVYYKYTDLFLGTVNFLAQDQLVPLQNIILPIAISFFTFQQIAYLVDCYRGHPPEQSLQKYSLFICFFPQFIAGPIVHHSDLIWQFERMPRRFGGSLDISVGSTIFIVGFIKKVVFADGAGIYSDAIFTATSEPDLITSWIGGLAYSMRIYFDFSGYSDMAVGLARLFGIVLPINFFSPYQSGSIVEFWRRWHITLSRFLKQYLYFSIGGNRVGRARQMVNIVIVMLLGGLWHGAAWTFVLWGGLHGIYIVLNQMWRAFGKFKIPYLPGLIITNICVIFAWVPFAASSSDVTFKIWKGMLGFNGVVLPEFLATTSLQKVFSFNNEPFRDIFLTGGGLSGASIFVGALLIAYLAPNLYTCFNIRNPVLDLKQFDYRLAYRFLRWRPSAIAASLLFLSFVSVIVHHVSSVEFLYFQF
jgi:alginate O-acetyltransferase complex protein AlgI